MHQRSLLKLAIYGIFFTFVACAALLFADAGTPHVESNEIDLFSRQTVIPLISIPAIISAVIYVTWTISKEKNKQDETRNIVIKLDKTISDLTAFMRKDILHRVKERHVMIRVFSKNLNPKEMQDIEGRLSELDDEAQREFDKIGM